MIAEWKIDPVTFNWSDLDGKKLLIKVVEQEGIGVVIGYEQETTTCYVLVEFKDGEQPCVN